MIDHLKTIFNLLKLFKKTPFYYKFHLVIRYILCPFLKLESLVPKKGNIIELGCGSGILTNILSLKSKGRKIKAIDIDGEKIKIANRTLQNRKEIEFIHQDIKGLDLEDESYSVFITADVIYQIGFDEQRKIFEKCFKALPQNGLLIIKTMSDHPKWKVFIDQFQDIISQKILRITKANQFFRFTDKELQNELIKAGFDVEIIRLDRFMTHPHIAFICKKLIDN